VIEIEKKSVIPVYGLMAVWVIYCISVSFSSAWHFVWLVVLGVLAYVILSLFFPGKTVSIDSTEKPQRTGDENVDALLAEGEKSVAEMSKLRDSIPNEEVNRKAGELVSVTDNIFKKLLAESSVYSQVKRFADFFLPTTLKLLNSYDRFSQSGVEGENITGTMDRINAALDTTLESYKKFYDSLFENQALDIETDITVFDTMLKKEGLLDPDFEAKTDSDTNTTEQV